MTTETTPVSAASTLVTPDPVTTTEVAAPVETPPTETPPVEVVPTLALPGKDATPEDWAKFYNSVGRPETAEAYELPIPEGDDGTFANTMKPLLHKHGLTAEQAKGLAGDWNAMTASIADAQAKAEAAADLAQHTKNTQEASELANEWGQANTANMEFAKRGIAQFVPGDAAQKQAVIAAVEKALGYKETIKFFHGIGKGLAEGGAVGLGSSESAPQRSIAERLYGPQP